MKNESSLSAKIEKNEKRFRSLIKGVRNHVSSPYGKMSGNKPSNDWADRPFTQFEKDWGNYGR